MSGHIEVYTERRGVVRRRTQYRWRVKASNGRIIATSGEGYSNLADLWHAVGLVVVALTGASKRPVSIHDGAPR